ncbi:MAG: hypothetical protein LHW54_02415 [Candidatus Cloacimonetes bacterium]|nr:hypothetical protein [Candidatus Cloacimonadota bacterium]
MGTQQILLIVLSVIIVGAAIAVGIQMFNSQSYSASKSALAADAQSYASQIVQYYKTPISQGGAGGTLPTGDGAEAKIAKFIGWGDEHPKTNDNSEFKIIVSSATNEVHVLGLSKEDNGTTKPAIKTTITLPQGEIKGTPEDVPSATTITTLAVTNFTD